MNFTKQLLIVLAMFRVSLVATSQNLAFTAQDTLRGSITAERAWWDLTFYHLDIKVSLPDSSFEGTNKISYQVLAPSQLMQIDLQKPMQITRVSQDGRNLDFGRVGNAWYVKLVKKQNTGDHNELIVGFGGKPQVSKRPPWSGGVSWKKDDHQNPFIVTTCQGDGASL